MGHVDALSRQTQCNAIDCNVPDKTKMIMDVHEYLIHRREKSVFEKLKEKGIDIKET
jgi:hypothetical protein